jgi:hypothetical protein
MTRPATLASLCTGLLLLCGCGDEPTRAPPTSQIQPTSQAPPTSPTPSVATALPSTPLPRASAPAAVEYDDPPIDPALLRRADPRYDDLVLRMGWPIGLRFTNVLYEGNNIVMRGDRRGGEETFVAEGAEIARRWREVARSGRGVFVLRDALFSQQDHPIEHDPFALSVPHAWVTVAVDAASGPKTLGVRGIPAGLDDAAWKGFVAAEAFGVLPLSERVATVAARPVAGQGEEDRRRTLNARHSLMQVAVCAALLERAVAVSVEEAARVGAACIADGDRRYFGAALRRSGVIPITVENPNRHEIDDEAKGFVVSGRKLPKAAIRIARDAVCRARLADGDLALERYDLTVAADRDRAVEVLEALLPEGSEGPRVWLWINGGLDARGIGGKPALPHVPAFLERLEGARIEVSRLRLLDKPHVDLGDTKTRRQRLDAALSAYGAVHMPVSTNLTSRALAGVVAD